MLASMVAADRIWASGPDNADVWDETTDMEYHETKQN